MRTKLVYVLLSLLIVLLFILHAVSCEKDDEIIPNSDDNTVYIGSVVGSWLVNETNQEAETRILWDFYLDHSFLWREESKDESNTSWQTTFEASGVFEIGKDIIMFEAKKIGALINPVTEQQSDEIIYYYPNDAEWSAFVSFPDYTYSIDKNKLILSYDANSDGSYTGTEDEYLVGVNQLPEMIKGIWIEKPFSGMELRQVYVFTETYYVWEFQEKDAAKNEWNMIIWCTDGVSMVKLDSIFFFPERAGGWDNGITRYITPDDPEWDYDDTAIEPYVFELSENELILKFDGNRDGDFDDYMTGSMDFEKYPDERTVFEKSENNVLIQDIEF